MKLLRALGKLIFGVIKFVAVVLAMIVGVGAILVIFAEDLPLGPPPATLSKFDAGPFVDLHAHVAGIGAGDSGCFISERLKENFRYRFYLYALGVTEGEVLREGDQLVIKRLSEKVRDSGYVDKAVILALDGVVDGQGELDRDATEIYVPNEYIAAEVAKYDNLLFGASINPYRKDALQRLIAAKQRGAVLVKWIPSIMRIDPSDQKLMPFYLALVELGLPLLTHTGAEASFSHAEDRLGDPQLLELPLKLGVTVIAAHVATTGTSGGQDNFDRIRPLFEKYPNLYADISSLTQINKLGYLARALKQETTRDRLLYGSDWPLQFFPVVSPWWHLPHISFRELQYISEVDNVFDKDVLLKRAIGVPTEIFDRSKTLLDQLAASSRLEALSKRAGADEPQPGERKQATLPAP